MRIERDNFVRHQWVKTDSEADSIKDVDNMIAPPTQCTWSGRMVRFNTTCSDYISWFNIQFLCKHAPGWYVCPVRHFIKIYVAVVKGYTFYLYPTRQCDWGQERDICPATYGLRFYKVLKSNQFHKLINLLLCGVYRINVFFIEYRIMT